MFAIPFDIKVERLECSGFCLWVDEEALQFTFLLLLKIYFMRVRAVLLESADLRWFLS